MGDTNKAYKCLTCANKEICKNEENMKSFTDELRKRVNVPENERFGVHIDCQDYRFYDKTKPQKNFEKITI